MEDAYEGSITDGYVMSREKARRVIRMGGAGGARVTEVSGGGQGADYGDVR